jgi:hypothetical protein
MILKMSQKLNVLTEYVSILPSSGIEVSLFIQADRLFTEMIEDIMTDVTLGVHQELLKNKKICSICLTRSVPFSLNHYCTYRMFLVVTKVSNSPELRINLSPVVHVPLSARTAGQSRAASPAPVELSRANSNNSQSGTATPNSGFKPDGNLYFECLNCGRPVKRCSFF